MLQTATLSIGMQTRPDMTQISSDEVRHLSLLCRVAMSDEDVEVRP